MTITQILNWSGLGGAYVVIGVAWRFILKHRRQIARMVDAGYAQGWDDAHETITGQRPAQGEAEQLAAEGLVPLPTRPVAIMGPDGRDTGQTVWVRGRHAAQGATLTAPDAAQLADLIVGGLDALRDQVLGAILPSPAPSPTSTIGTPGAETPMCGYVDPYGMHCSYPLNHEGDHQPPYLG